MQVCMLRAKIHRATVTDSNLNYVGSVTIDRELMEAAGIFVNEQVHVANVTNGQRLVTYVMEGERGSQTICLNGAAARLAAIGDTVIIFAYAHIDIKEAPNFKPVIVLVDEKNKMRNVL
jgi:aspartate 1-decarboxylase